MKNPSGHAAVIAFHKKVSKERRGSLDSETQGVLDYVVNKINNAMSFYLTTKAQAFLNNTYLRVEDLNGMQLPYDDLFLELEHPVFKNTHGNIVYLLCHYSVTELMDNSGEVVTQILYFKDGKNGTWTRLPLTLEISLESFNNIEKWISVGKDGIITIVGTPSTCGYGPKDVVVPVPGRAVDPEMEQIFHVHGIAMLLKLMTVLSCSNAPTQVVDTREYNSAKRNRKKPNVPPYTILTITESDEGLSANGGASTGGTKRTHIRRGHIHSYHTLKGLIKKWIKPMVVAAKNEDKIITEKIVN